MTREELNQKMLSLIESPGFPKGFDPGTLGDVLLDELEESWDSMPDTTKAVVLGVATSLKKRYADELVSDLKADFVVKNMRDR